MSESLLVSTGAKQLLVKPTTIGVRVSEQVNHYVRSVELITNQKLTLSNEGGVGWSDFANVHCP